MHIDRCLRDNTIQGLNIFDTNGNTAVHECSWFKRANSLRYLLTCVPKPLIDTMTVRGASPIHFAIRCGNGDNNDMNVCLKLLIDFGASVDVEDEQEQTLYDSATKLADEFPRNSYPQYLLNDQFGYLAEKAKDVSLTLSAQLLCKHHVDALFRVDASSAATTGERFNKAEVDAAYEPLWEQLYPGVKPACDSGDLDLLQRSMTSGKLKLGFLLLAALISDALSNGHVHLMEYFCKIIFSAHCSRAVDDIEGGYTSCFNLHAKSTATFVDEKLDEKFFIYDLLLQKREVLAYDLLERLLYSGLDPLRPRLIVVKHLSNWMAHATYTKAMAPKLEPLSIIKCIIRTRILCLFKILYHKFIYLGIESIFHLVQTLLFETDNGTDF